MEDYVANTTPRQFFYENLYKVIKSSESLSEVDTYFSNPFHQLDKDPFNQNDVRFIEFLRGNLAWMKNFKQDKADVLYWVNSMISNIGSGTV